MKKTTIIIFFLIALLKTQAQDYLIGFAGAGASTTVDSVIVENATQCTSLILSGSDILNLLVTVGINDFSGSSDNSLHIYPNPMTGSCSVDFEATAQGITTLELFDQCGKRIMEVQELLSKGHHTYSLSGIRSGLYMLKIESDKFSYTAKIVSNNTQSGKTDIRHIETAPGINKQITITNTVMPMNLNGGKSVIDMPYTTGDILKFTGKSGNYRTVFILVPTQNQTVTFNFVACSDADSNHYAVVQIGTQLWMAENIKVGVKISGTQDQTNNGIIEKYCYNDADNNCTIYGGLYKWNEMMQYATTPGVQGICPTGWHLPTDVEWTTLTDYLLGRPVAGGKMKETCTALWWSPNVAATNSSGFTGLPGGRCGDGGYFDGMSGMAFFWGSTQFSAPLAENWQLSYFAPHVNGGTTFKTEGYSVRCVQDQQKVR
jgi:uncharacterized protein (TIGR02145 family)